MFSHKSSTDEKPVHNFSRDDVCPYRKAVIAGTVNTYHHKNSLPAACMEAIKPVFKELNKMQVNGPEW